MSFSIVKSPFWRAFNQWQVFSKPPKGKQWKFLNELCSLEKFANSINISSFEVFVKRSVTLDEFFFKKLNEFPTPLIIPKLRSVLKDAGPGKPTLTGNFIFELSKNLHHLINGSALKKKLLKS